jgi:hypothetical protein
MIRETQPRRKHEAASRPTAVIRNEKAVADAHVEGTSRVRRGHVVGPETIDRTLASI